MIQVSQIERRCSKLASSLEARASDEVTLLRTARVLKQVNADLRRVVWIRAKEAGWTAETAAAEAALNAMERNLRRALLDHLSLEKDQLRSHLICAVDRSLETVHMLQ